MKTAARGTLALVSLGCAKNAVDLQNRAGAMLKDGWTLSSDPDRADVVIVNTCAFIASAREEAEAEITRAVQLKANGAEVEGRGVSSDTLKANMRAIFGGVNLLYKK